MAKIHLLSYARFVASLSVVLSHYFEIGFDSEKITGVPPFHGLSKPVEYGFVMVCFLFIVSGYVIYYSAANKTASAFMYSRMKRLYPAYWVGIIFTSIFALLWTTNPQMTVDAKQILINFTMFQGFINVKNVDGAHWTLLFELTFYFVIFFILLVSNSKKLVQFFKIWPFLMIPVFLLKINLPPFNGYFAYFALGALLAQYRSEKNYTVTIPLFVSILLCIYQINQRSETTMDYVYYSLFMSIAIAFFFILNLEKVQKLHLPHANLIGNLTYPIYLIHTHFGYMFISRFAPGNNKVVIILLTMAIVYTSAFIIHKVVEVGLSNQWSKFFKLLAKPAHYLEQNIIGKYKSSKLETVTASVQKKDAAPKQPVNAGGER